MPNDAGYHEGESPMSMSTELQRLISSADMRHLMLEAGYASTSSGSLSTQERLDPSASSYSTSSAPFDEKLSESSVSEELQRLFSSSVQRNLLDRSCGGSGGGGGHMSFEERVARSRSTHSPSRSPARRATRRRGASRRPRSAQW